MRSTLSIAVILVGACGALGLYFGLETNRKAQAQAVAEEVDGRLRETIAAIHSRASTLADLPIMESVVSTDAATARDLTAKELAFRTKPGETIEIGQVFSDGRTTSLLRLPEGSQPLIFSSPGIHLRLNDGKVVLDEVTNVRPSEHGESLRGALAVAWPADLTNVATHLDSLGIGAELQVTGSSVPISSHEPPGGQAFDLPLHAVSGADVHLITRVRPVSPIPSAAVGLVALVVGALLWRSRPRVAAQPATRLPSLTDPVPLPAAPAPSVNTTPAPAPATSASVSPFAGTAMAVPSTMPSSISGGNTQQIGRYTILKQLGSGGMAEVYLARATGEAGFEKLVALKVLQKRLAMQPVVVEHFLDEAKLASRLTHPNIVQISDLGRAGDEYFIAMEYIDGADLGQLLAGVVDRGGQVPVKVALAIVRRICDGLHAAHNAKNQEGVALEIVHRDVKSANVFVARNGAVKLGDFGIAKANQASRVNKTELGQVKGTAAYMAPEHRLGKAVDRRADIYAVGAIAYEVLTGTEVNLDLAVLADLGRVGWPHLTPPSLLRPELPAELDAILWKAMAYERDDRYDDTEKFEEALAEVVDKHSLQASDKIIAQWVESEMQLTAAAGDRNTTPSPSSQVV